MAAKTKAEKEAEALVAEEARREALTEDERAAEDKEIADKAAEDEAKSSKTSITVAYDGTTREYSKAVHGADFKALAQEFATKRNGKIV